MNPKDLEVGDFFTIVRWRNNDRSFVGDCLEVKVLDYPFVRALRHDGYFAGSLRTFYLKELEVMLLSQEFIESVLAEK